MEADTEVVVVEVGMEADMVVVVMDMGMEDTEVVEMEIKLFCVSLATSLSRRSLHRIAAERTSFEILASESQQVARLLHLSWSAEDARLCRVSSASNFSLVEGEESQNPALNEGFRNLEPVKGTAFGGLLGTSGAFLSRSSNVEARPVPNSHRFVVHGSRIFFRHRLPAVIEEGTCFYVPFLIRKSLQNQKMPAHRAKSDKHDVAKPHRRDPYEVLGVSKSSTDQDIKSAYRRMALNLNFEFAIGSVLLFEVDVLGVNLCCRLVAKCAFFPPSLATYSVKKCDGDGGKAVAVSTAALIRDDSSLDVLLLDTKRVNKIVAFYLRNPSARLTLLYSHGNAGDLGQLYDLFVQLKANLRPSEANTYADIEAVYECLETEYGVSQEDLILYGQSVGSGPTLYLAAKLPRLSGVVLHSAILSGLRVVCHVKFTFCFDIYKNVNKIRKVKCPVLVIHVSRN
ncbi:hypothetical protein U1Q18_001140 [Sarracenia purpurea var. burkii]